MIRHSHLFRGQLKKEVFDMNTSIAMFRERCEKGASRYAKMPPGVTTAATTIGQMAAEWLIPDQAPENKVIFYVHGGGYVSGSVNDHRAIIAKFAKNTGVKCLLYEYRLAPEHPYPAALDDSVEAYRWILSLGFDPASVVVAGESAGGGLALALLLVLQHNNIPLPAAAVALSPWTDLTCSGDSYRTKNHRSPAPTDSWHVFGKHYRADHPADHPFISPLFGDLKGLPPLLINAGVDDELFDDGRLFAQKAEEQGVKVVFRAGHRQIHCYPLLAPMFPEASEAMNEIVTFIKARLEANPQ